MKISVRVAGSGDVGTIAEFNARLAAESEDKKLDLATVRAGVAALIADPQKGRYYLAESDGRIVGQVAVTFEWSDWRNGWFWWLQSVYVHAENRGQSVFRALYEAVQYEAVKLNVVGLRLYVEQSNDVGQSSYRSIGMTLTSYLVYEKSL
ncbi:MAG: GNAT family N-acetyltransferase [Gemmataceae bacterium]